MTGLLLVLAMGFFAAAVIAIFCYDNPMVFFGAAVLAMACGIGALATLASNEQDDCHSKGGHMVADGPPYYVKSGEMLVPIQSYRCETP